MTFKEAFTKARKEKGAGATFTWNGKQYTTDYKEENGPTRPQPRPETEGTSRTTRPRARPSAATPKVTTTSLDRNRKSDDRTQAQRRMVERAIGRAEKANAGASMKPTQTSTRKLQPTVGQRLKEVFGNVSFPKANRGRNK